MPLTDEDRLALRRLVDAYAEAVDRRDPAAVADLFLADGRLLVPDPAHPDRPFTVRTGRQEIAGALGRLLHYVALTHLVGGQVLATETADVAPDPIACTGVTTCLAHHVYEHEGRHRISVLGIHYHDTYDYRDGRWRFAERRLEIGWRDDRPLGEEP